MNDFKSFLVFLFAVLAGGAFCFARISFAQRRLPQGLL